MFRLLSLLFLAGSCFCQYEVAESNATAVLTPQQVAAVACSQEYRPAKLTGILGKIESLDFPRAPEDDIYCEYLIEPDSATANSGIVVAVKYLYTEPDFDVVTVYEGDQPNPLNKRREWSGFVPADYSVEIANTSSALITFENDCWTSYDKGFELVYYSMDISESAQDLATDACDGTEAVTLLDETNNIVFLESRYFPSDYPQEESCTWIIKAACDEQGNSHNLTITLLEFELYENDIDDYVEIFRDRGPNAELLETLTDSYDPMSFSLDIEYGTMEVRFATDYGYTTEKGFRMAVSFSDTPFKL